MGLLILSCVMEHSGRRRGSCRSRDSAHTESKQSEREHRTRCKAGIVPETEALAWKVLHAPCHPHGSPIRHQI